MTRGATKAHIVRAALESMAYQTCDVLTAMKNEATLSLTSLRVDGGASANNFLLQFQSDILNIPLLRPACVETTAWGAATLAGLSVGVFADKAALAREWKSDRSFSPQMAENERAALLDGWKRAVERNLRWADCAE